MSSDSLDKDLSLALRKIDEAWHAVARYERNRSKIAPRRRRDSLPIVSPAWMLDITYQTDGSAWVRINEQHEFRLPPKLGQLLELLAADNGRAADGSVDWKPADSLRAALAKASSAAPLDEHTFNQRVHRLRDELVAQKLHPGLVQYNRELQAYRFALRAT